jgi:hypothetical protein
MKKLLAICALVALIVALGTTAQATVITLNFDPNDILDLYPASAGDEDVTGKNKSTQMNARRIHDDWCNPYYETFYNPTAAHTQPKDYNTYVNWRNSLDDEGEGLAMFNSWFLDNPAARSWGETVVVKPYTELTATAGDGWNYRIIANPYGLGGGSVQWWTTDSSKRLRPTDLGGADIGEFSITLDLYHDIGSAGWDYRSAAKDYGSGFEGVLSATAVPEPATMLLLGSGLIGLAGLGRKKFFKKS